MSLFRDGFAEGTRRYGTLANQRSCTACSGHNTQYLREDGNDLKYYCDDCKKGFTVKKP